MNYIFTFVILIIGILGMSLGVFAGLLFKNKQLRSGLKVISSAFLRVTKKKWQRLTTPDFDAKRRQKDNLFIALSADKKEGMADVRSIEAVTVLRENLMSKFDGQVKSVYIFGSRVRGDYQFGSDVDVAVFMVESLGASRQIKREILFQTVKLLIKYGLFVQTRVFSKFIGNKMHEPDDYLARVIVDSGIAV